MSESRRLTIEIDPRTAGQLTAAGFRLQLFKAIMTSATQVTPALWTQIKDLRPRMEVGWSDRFRAFAVSLERQRSSSFMQVPFETEIEPGQTARIISGIRGETIAGALPGAIGLVNAAGTSLLCGIEQLQDVDGRPTPLCGLPLDPDETISIRPLERLLLRFAGAAEQGARGRFFSPALIVDYDGDSRRTVSYAADSGWTCDAPCAAAQTSAPDLMAALIIPPSFLP